MSFYLAPHLHAAAFGRDLVLLDVDEGEYRLLAGLADELTFDGPKRRFKTTNSELSGALLAAGVLTPLSVKMVRPPPPPSPICSALEGASLPLRLSDVLQMMRAYGEMVRRYYGRGLPRLLQEASRGADKIPHSSMPADAVAKAALAFDKLSPWTPFQGDCLFRCFMLLQWLHGAGATGVRWVFGVRTGPFYAHCWLQAGDVALTDFADTLVNFVPIYAV